MGKTIDIVVGKVNVSSEEGIVENAFEEIAMPKQSLHTRAATKCVVDGIHAVLHSDGPTDKPAGQSFAKIRRAPRTDLVTGLTVNDFVRARGLHIDLFVAGDCSALPDDIKVRLWDAIVDVADFYWRQNPLLGNPFPRASFTQPTITCPDTIVGDLVTELRNKWLAAQP